MADSKARTRLPSAPLNTCSGYVRLSREAMESNLSKDGMAEDIVALAAARGLRMIDMHIDDGLSGAIRNRPEFVAWLDDARQGRADHLVAWHVDRMTREGVNVAAIILDVIEGKDPVTGAQVRERATLLDTKGLDSSGDDSFRYRFVIQAEVARSERERMKDRNKSAYRRAVAAGRWPGGPPPFGFKIVDNPDGAGKVLAVAEIEAAMIREIAARALAGSTLSAVVRYANSKDGVAPRRTEFWSRVTVRQVLTGDAARGVILTADESAALRHRLTPKPDAKRERRNGLRMLSGLLRCHACNEVMVAAVRTNGEATYRCHTSQYRTCKRPVVISCKALEAFIGQRFLSQYGAHDHVIRKAEVAGAAAVEFAEEAVTEALAVIGAAATVEAFEALREAQERLRVAQEIPAETIAYLAYTGKTISEVWEEGSDLDRRDLLAVNIAAIVVKPGERGYYAGHGGINPNRLAILDTPPYAGGGAGLAPGRIVADGVGLAGLLIAPEKTPAKRRPYGLPA